MVTGISYQILPADSKPIQLQTSQSFARFVRAFLFLEVVMFCVVERDLARHLRRYDADQARSEWLDAKANNDGFTAYFEQAMEQIEESELSADDYQYLIDNGDVDGLSKLGLQVVKDKAIELAIASNYSLYE